MKKERNTYQKTLIKDIVLNMCTHPSADEVFEKVKEQCPTVSRSTVYRILNDLADKGEVYRVKVLDGPDRYDKTMCRHYHVKCTKCGSVADSEYFEKDNIEIAPEKCSGYKVTGYEICFEGICPECLSDNN